MAAEACGWVVFGYKPDPGSKKQPREVQLSARMSGQLAAEHYRDLCIREGYVVTGIRFVLSREAARHHLPQDLPKWRGAR